MYLQRDTRYVWCWMDQSRCACRLDDDDRSIQFLSAFASEEMRQLLHTGTVLGEIG